MRGRAWSMIGLGAVLVSVATGCATGSSTNEPTPQAVSTVSATVGSPSTSSGVSSAPVATSASVTSTLPPTAATTSVTEPAIATILQKVAGGRPADAKAVACAVRGLRSTDLPADLAARALSDPLVVPVVQAALVCDRNDVIAHIANAMVTAGVTDPKAQQYAPLLVQVLTTSKSALSWYLSNQPTDASPGIADIVAVALGTQCPTCAREDIDAMLVFVADHPPIDQTS